MGRKPKTFADKLRWALADGPLTAAQIASRTAMKTRHVSAYLARLRGDGVIAHVADVIDSHGHIIWLWGLTVPGSCELERCWPIPGVQLPQGEARTVAGGLQ